MRKTKFLVVLSALSLLTAAPMLFSAHQVNGEGVALSGLEIDETYNIGDMIYILKDATLTEGEKSVKVVSSYLSYPNGAIMSAKSYKLDSFGKYRLVLMGEDGLTYSKEFAVWKDVYSLGVDKSTIDYGALNKNFVDSGYSEGLILNLAEGDTFTYNKPIDLSSKGKYQELISWNLHDLSKNPVCHSISVRFTDAYDPENYFTITNNKGTYYYENYILASYNGGRGVGLSKDDSGTIEIDGESYRISSEGGLTLSGNNPTSGLYNNLTYYLDTSNPLNYRIYAKNHSADYGLVTEFNNEKIYNNSFSGFKTGLVYVSITASGFSGVDRATLEIAEIGGVKGSDLNPMDYYKDETKPLIDLPIESEAKVMGGIEIKIPEAKAYDDTGLKGEIEKSVWYGYDSTSKKMITTDDGRFTPDELGVYTIIYKATDVYGNVSEERADLFVSEFGETGIDFELEPFQEIRAGTEMTFDNYKAQSLNGDCQTDVDVLFPNGETKTIKGGESLLLDYSGTYKATYRYHDSFYSGSKEYSFEVAKTEKAEFSVQEISLPHFFMKGGSYSIDIPVAYAYGENGKQSDQIDFFMSVDGGEYRPADASDVKIEGSKNVRFKAAPKTNPLDVIETEEVPIVDVGWDGRKIDLTKYFVGDFTGHNQMGADGKDADYVSYLANRSGTAEMEFINKLLLSTFEFNFKATDFSKVTVNLVSMRNSGKKIEIGFEGNAVLVNGRRQTAVENVFAGGASIAYDSSLSRLSVAGAHFDLTNDFEGDSLLLEIVGDGAISGQSAIDVSKVGNQPFRSNNSRDRISPMCSASFPERTAQVGDIVKISKPNIADVLTPISDVNASLTVIKNVNGKVSEVYDLNSKLPLTKINDFSKDYEIKLDDYGSYIISYSTTDGAGNSSGGLKEMVSVLDTEAPTILTKIDQYTINAGVESELPTFEATDNISDSSKLETWHLIYDSKNRLAASVLGGEKVSLKEKGRYTAYVTIQDEEGNVAYAHYVLIVE